MNTRSNQLYRTAATTCGVAALILLSACSSGNSGSEKYDDASSVSRPSQSAAALATESTNSLSYAQAVAAGVADPAQSPAALAAEATNQPEVAEAKPEVEAKPAASSAGSIAQAQAKPVEATTVETTTPVAIKPETTPEPETQPQTKPDTSVAETTQPDTTLVTTETVTNTPENQPAQTSAPELGQAVTGQAKSFSSHTTDGFTGEVANDGTVTVRWQKDPKARGYNVYRQAQYITTIFGEEWVQSDLYDESYYYEIQAFDAADNLYYVARGLTVDVTGTGRTNPDAKPTNDGLLDDYELVFSDEFNGDSLDKSKWNTEYLWGPDLVINSEEQYYVNINNDPNFGFDPFTFDGENLTINSIRTPDALLEKANGQKYLSGVITSYDAFKFTYGYVEARAKMPYGKGYWPAFWLLNAYYVDDKPEIDIMEFIGDDQDVVYHTYHYYDADGNLRSTKSKPTPGIDFTGDYHVFGAEWKPGTVIFYIDGVETHRISDPKISQQDMYIIANTAIGGWWPGSPDETTGFPGEYKIDYIRAYQRIQPYEDFPFFDYTTQVPFADDVPGSSPNHLPPFELWPEGYPERAQ